MMKRQLCLTLKHWDLVKSENAVCPAHWKKGGKRRHSWTTKFGYKLFTAWTYYLNDTALRSMFVLDLESPAAVQMFFKINDVMVSFINKQAKCLLSYKLLNLKLIISSFTLFVTRIFSSAHLLIWGHLSHKDMHIRSLFIPDIVTITYCQETTHIIVLSLESWQQATKQQQLAIR